MLFAVEADPKSTDINPAERGLHLMQVIGLALDIGDCHIALGSVLNLVQLVGARINSQSFTITNCAP